MFRINRHAAVFGRTKRLLTTLSTWSVLAISLSACSVVGLGEEDRDSIVGIWQHTMPGDIQLSLEIFDDGTWYEVDADIASQRCGTARGVWTEVAGVITATETERNGVPISRVEEVIPYTISGSTLTFDPGSDEPEAYSAIDTMPTCSDYGWPTFTMSVEIDGVPFDFSSNPAPITLNDAFGVLLRMEGWYEPNGRDNNCPACKEMGIQVLAGPATQLTVGSYPVGEASDTIPTADIFLWVDFPATEVYYTSSDGDGISQPWFGSIEVTAVDPLLIQGTFEATLYDGRAMGPPFPLLSLTKGIFRVSYE